MIRSQRKFAHTPPFPTMVSGLRGAPGCSPASIPCLLKILCTVIAIIAANLEPVGWPNIDEVTCLLTPPQLYEGVSIRRRTVHCKEDIDAGKYPIATTVTNLLIIAYNFLLVDNTKNGMEDSCSLLSNATFLSKLHENPFRYIIYHSVLPFTQL